MKQLITLFLSVFLSQQAYTQDSINRTTRDTIITPNPLHTSPYRTKFKVDAPIIAGGIGLTYLGVRLINDKSDLTPTQLDVESKRSVPFFDRGNVGYYSEKADKDSYIPFHAAFAMPVVMMLVNKNERKHWGQVLVLYTETMAITGTLFTLSAGLIDRSRPYVYGENTPMDKRLGKTGQRSFFAGHTAATAAATFFTAKTFADFNPDSKARPYIWAVAATVPALVGYLRYKAGMHFLSDNLLGYGIGAATGILVPHLHKRKKMQNITVIPQVGNDYRGVAINYRFR